MKKFCIIMVGVPAAGKTTVVNELKNHFQFDVASSDDYIQDLADRAGKTYNDMFFKHIKEADLHYERQIKNAFLHNRNLVCDRTFLTAKFRQRVLRKVPAGYERIAVFFPTPEPAEHRRRLQARPGKEIPRDTLKRMIDSVTMPSMDEGFDLVINAETFMNALKS